jgi:hypothetical protein
LMNAVLFCLKLTNIGHAGEFTDSILVNRSESSAKAIIIGSIDEANLR